MKVLKTPKKCNNCQDIITEGLMIRTTGKPKLYYCSKKCFQNSLQGLMDKKIFEYIRIDPQGYLGEEEIMGSPPNDYEQDILKRVGSGQILKGKKI